MDYSAVVVAAGKSERFAGKINKLLYPLADGSLVIDKALKLFREDKDCKQIVIVTNEKTIEYLANNRASGKESYCFGGATRSDSVFHGLLAVISNKVLVHDGARCYLIKEDLENLKKELEKEQAAILVKQETDTVKKVSGDYIVSTIDRNSLRRALTPQGFNTEQLIKAYVKARKDNFLATDEASVMEKYSDVKIKCVNSKGHNSKITTLEDIKRFK